MGLWELILGDVIVPDGLVAEVLDAASSISAYVVNFALGICACIMRCSFVFDYLDSSSLFVAACIPVAYILVMTFAAEST